MKKFITKFALEKSKITLLLTLVITTTFTFGIRYLLMDDNIMNMLPEDTPSRKIWDNIEDEFKYSDFLFIAFGNKNKEALSNKNISTLWDLSEKLNNLDGIEEVISLTTPTWLLTFKLSSLFWKTVKYFLVKACFIFMNSYFPSIDSTRSIIHF